MTSDGVPSGPTALEQHLALKRQAGEIVQQREVAGEERRLGEMLRCAHGRGDTPSIPFCPPIGHHSQGLSVLYVEGVHGTDAHGIRRKEARAFRRQLEKRAHVGAFRGLGIVGGHAVPFHSENAQARLVVEGDPGVSEARWALRPSARHPLRTNPRGVVPTNTSVAALKSRVSATSTASETGRVRSSKAGCASSR